jgi:tryptophan synthase alpha subunit
MAEAGFDALDVTDLPYEEHGEMKPACCAGNICLISTIHPAADCRRAQTIAQDAQGFIKTLSPADDSITTLPVITARSIKYLG